MHTKLYNIASILIEKEQNPKEKARYNLIKQILEDKNCFFKLDTETACTIIRDLGFDKKETLDIYQELISQKNY